MDVIYVANVFYVGDVFTQKNRSITSTIRFFFVMKANKI